MIVVEHVTKRFGRAIAVHDASFEIPQGRALALWGANGAGKTTLIRCVLGLIRFEGRVTVAGFDVRRQGKAARRAIGYVPQELGFYDELSVGEAIQFFSRLKGLGRPDTRAALAHVGLEGQDSKRVRELSGGMKQRLALAIALLGDPPVLVLDEVTASLDAVGRGEFVGLLEQLSGSGRTLLFASHRVEEVASLAHRVAVLELGSVDRIETCAQFVASQGGGTVLHLTIDAAARARALQVLRIAGFSAQLNGVGVLVPVASEHKAAPLRLLADACVTVDNFEIVTLAKAVSLAAHSAKGHA